MEDVSAAWTSLRDEDSVGEGKASARVGNDIKHQRADFLNNMLKIEEQLKKRIPDLFVSEFELCDLQREEYEIQEKIKAQSVQLSNAQVCLKGVLEDMSMLQCYSDDDEDDLAQLNI